jgi:hypothetical protein
MAFAACGAVFYEKRLCQPKRRGLRGNIVGYIRTLKAYSNFHLLILNDLSALHAGSVLAYQRNASMAANCWSGEEPLMIPYHINIDRK